MTKKGKLRKGISILLAVCMALPVGFVTKSETVHGKVIDADTTKRELWSTSFESADGFKTSTVDDKKGTANITTNELSYQINGNLSGEIESYSGSAAKNDNEVLKNLFDGNSRTKYLTEVKPSEVIVKLKSQQVIKSYAITSANDAPGRDPKNWSLQGRNSDNESWVTIDNKANQVFNGRYKQNYFELDNSKAYRQYRLRITANKNGGSMTQFSEFILATGKCQEVGASISRMNSNITSGPSDAWNQKSNVGWTGNHSLVCKGTHVGTGHAYSYNVIYDNLNLTVSDNTNLRYVIFPSMSNGDEYDYEYTQMHMAVDLKFKDGTYLSELGAIDQNGNKVDAQSQGDSRTLVAQQWNEIYSKIGDVAKGKVIEKILVVYDMKAHNARALAKFQTYFDDIEIYNQDYPVYSHLSDYVNILRGTNNTGNFSRGLTIPAVTVPNGFNFWIPATSASSNSAYEYQKTDEFRCMRISHEPSIWVGDRGTWQFMVNTSKDYNTNDDYGLGTLKANFSHDNEVAKAHYYKVSFDGNGGDAANSQIELTPTSHGAVVRFTYNNTANKSVIFDCANGGSRTEYSGNTFKTYSDHTGNGSKRMYIYGEFSETPKGTKINDRKSIASFNSNRVTMKLATSYISYDQAKKNLELEIGGDSFETVYNKAQSKWDNQLGIITDVKGANYEQLVTLYSCIYRMYCYPNLMSENTGSNSNPVWKYKSPYKDDNADPVEGKIYINNGFWDTYRTAWSGYGLFTPSKATELLNGLVQHYKDQGWLPRWIAPGGTNSMVGTSSDAIFADAMVKGISFDYENAYRSALRNAATVSDNLTNGGRKKLNISNFIGYVPADENENFSWSMEGYINDYGIAQMAKKLADQTNDATKKANYMSEYYYYLNRAKNYSLLFDDSGQDVTSKWLRGRKTDGSLNLGNSDNNTGFNPFWWGADYTETNAFNMAVSVPQDGIGLANLYGGRDQLADKLDTIFTTDGGYIGYGGMDGVGGIHEQREAREVKLGQYGHSNQPSHHIPYMYLYSSRPWETQKYVRDILARCYAGSTFGQGYIGDEDNGEMSAWYVLSSIGFYPLSMGNDEFAIGSPQFEEVTVNLEGNKKLVIKANNNSKKNVYVDSMYVNGEKYDKTFIKYEDLIKGGTIEFNMSSTPNKERGLEQDSLTSITKDDNKPQVYTDYSKDANKSSSTGVTTLDNLFDDNSDTETKVDNTTTLMFKFTDKKAVRMLTLTSSKSGRTPDRAQVYGDNEDDNWVLLGDYHDSGSLFFNVWGKYTRPFVISADKVGKYSRYKVVLTGTDAYLSEVEMLGYKDNGILKSDLKNAIDVAKSIDTTGEYPQIVKRLKNNLKEACSVYDNEEASDDEILKAYQSLGRIVDIEKKTIKIHDASQVEAEEFDAKSDHIVNDGKNIGGVEKNTWVRYDSVYFNGLASQVSFNYSGQKSDAGGYAQVYIDSKVGEPVATINLPVTGDNWSTYTTVSQQLEKSISGLHDIYIVFKNDGSHKYVANVDNIAFDVKSVEEKDNIPSGYTEATVNQWTPSGKWGCYFGNWSGTASGSYKWASDADYNIYVDKANKGTAWLVQGSYTDNVTNGHTYKVTVDVTASKACSIGIKEDLSNEKDLQVYTDIPANGTRTLTGTYTVTNNQIKVMFELGQNVDAGTNINFKNIKIEDLTVETTKEPTPTTVAPTTEAPTAIGPTTVVPTTTVAPTTVAPTTVVPTTAAPTTVAPTTVAPTTVAPTTVAPTTVAPTTAAPTTVAPTTVAPTTAAPTTEAPITTVAPTTTVDEDAVPTPIGLIYAGNETLPYYFIWQAPASDIESYNVYVDGKLVAASGTPSINLTADAFASGNGDYTVSVKSVRNGKESKATSITYTYTGGTVDKPTTVAPTTQSETSTAAIGEGSNAGKVDSEILNCRNDKDLAGSTFGKLCVKVKKSKKKAISLTWKKIQVAKTYVIYGAKCGTSYKKIATVHRKTFTNKKLKKGTYYKYMVVALNEKGEVVAISKLIHVATKGGKVGNCKKLKVNKSKVNLKQGKKFKLKVKQIAESKKVKLKKHRKIAFESDNQDVAVVSKKGIITAKKKGKCSVYVYAQNGVYKKIKIRVN